jgi:hypothetical protein
MTIMIAAMCTVVLVVLLSLGIFIYYRKCSKTPIPDGSTGVPNTSVSNSVVGGSSSKLDDVYEDQYHPKANADLIMHGDIDFNFKKKKTIDADPVISEAAASNEEDSEGDASPDRHRVNTEDDSDRGIVFTKAGEGAMKEDTPLHDGEAAVKSFAQ